MPEPRIVITSGEPAGIGPDIVAQLDPSTFDARLIVIGDQDLLQTRAQSIGAIPGFVDYDTSNQPGNALEVIHQPLSGPCQPGQLNPANAGYVLSLLDRASKGCLDGEFDAMVTAPVNKEIINRAGIEFSGHTEYLADICEVTQPVMLLHTGQLRVALVTTHLPLRQVADAITVDRIRQVSTTLARDLQRRFGLDQAHIKVCGLNPHAGENGYLGREEIDVIIPAIESLNKDGLRLSGPYPADTLFTPAGLNDADAVLAMFHDQGLPVIKNVGFHNAVNSTLGLPIIRTSVDHGTALDLAGSGKANGDSLQAAIVSAISQARHASTA